jgi:hypothetical protein
VAALPLVLLLGVTATILIGVALAHRSPPSREAAVAAGRAHAVRAATAAVVLGAMAAVYAGTAGLGNHEPGGLGVTALLVPITFGVVHTVVLALGELTWPRPQGEVRRARLVRRGLLDAAPHWLVRTAAVAAVLAVVTLLAGGLLADDDGRGFSYGDPLTEEGFLATAGPFPGSFYGVPAGVGLLVLTLVAVATLRIVATRPAVATSDEGVEATLRRASAHRVLRVAVGVPLFVTGGLLLVGGRAMHSVASSGVAPGLYEMAGAAASLLGAAAMLAGVVIACLRAPGVPAGAPAVPAG